MADDTTKRGGQDRARISLSEDYEVEYFARKGCVPRGGVRRPARTKRSGAVQRSRYLTLESVAPLGDDPLVSLPAVAS
jgi:hypothetical protein